MQAKQIISYNGGKQQLVQEASSGPLKHSSIAIHETTSMQKGNERGKQSSELASNRTRLELVLNLGRISAHNFRT